MKIKPEEKKRNTVSLLGVHRTRSEEPGNVFCFLLFSAGKTVLEVALVEEGIVEWEIKDVTADFSGSSVSFVICVFYQYLSVSSLGLGRQARPAQGYALVVFPRPALLAVPHPILLVHHLLE